ncbi:TetR/AcrR family transcriptional regulator [Solirubrobacter phytolaccae]|uniref:TetR/AcrR family transcriptional regulator n=1 Tax=Solirubrobacter phytolaccae TaxID=1404360 RepID=A0A9X3NDC6_9ACTN|nr:TetR/AcrR family transcriptional regulator [Solirubrobacter phytolaccae]MDA0184036.1 TetR/AcrR family transcriptional regulator [Solirubrobacter phytolaccae]
MAVDTESEREGLRERKKRQTRDTIVRTALELFDRQGFAATTIPEIAEAANVSPRTVSTYFQAKEDLVFPGTTEMFERLEALLSARGPDKTTADTLRTWFAEEVPRLESEHFVVARRVIQSSEHLIGYSGRFRARGEEIIARSIAEDLSADPGELEPRLASAATLAIFGVLDSLKDKQDDCAPTDHTAALGLLDRALLFVDAGIRALRDSPPSS